MKFLNELYTKHESIKFECQISKTSITFLDTEVYVKNNKLCTKIYGRKTGCQTFLDINSEHLKSLKVSIPYSQALRIKIICSKTTDFEHHLQELKERLVNQGYNKKPINQQFSKVKTTDRNELLKEKTDDKEPQNKTPLVLTYNRILPNIRNIVRKHWSIVNISRILQGLFQEGPITAFKRSRNQKELIGSNCIENGKVKRAKNTFTIGKCPPCLSKIYGSLCCRQLTSTTTFVSQKAKRKFKIYRKANCKSEYVIYLMECKLGNKQYAGTAETAFNIRPNNHRTDTKDPNAILACRLFQKQGHNFNCHPKFIITDKLVNNSSSKDILRERLIQRENFWIQKLKTLVPYGLNQELGKQKMRTLTLPFHVHFYLKHSSQVTLELR